MARVSDNDRSLAYAALRRMRPSGVAAILEDGEVRELKVREGKGKWEKVLQTATALGAVGLECREPDGAIIEIVPMDGAPQRVEQEMGAASVSMAPANDLERTLKLCADFADRATARQQDMLSAVCETAIQVMKASADRAERSERALDKVLRAHEKVLMTRTSAGDGDGMDQSDMLAMMVAMMNGGNPAALQQLGAGKPGNGHAEPMVPVPASVVARVQKALAQDPSLLDGFGEED